MTDLKSLNRVELEQFFQELGTKVHYQRSFSGCGMGWRSFDEILNLSKALREKLLAGPS